MTEPVSLLPKLYDLALAAGGASAAHPLLTRFLERLLVHTGLPLGIALQTVPLGSEPQAILDVVVGDPQLAMLAGSPVQVPDAWLSDAQGEVSGLPPSIPGLPRLDGYGQAWRLVIPDYGLLVLLGPKGGKDPDLVGHLSPVLSNLAEALRHCATPVAKAEHARQTEDSKDLARRAKTYSALADGSVLGIVLLDPSTLRFKEFNDTACASLGYTRAEFSSMGLPDILPPQSSDHTAQRFRRIWAQGAAEFETKYRRKDGGVRDYWVGVHPLNMGDTDYLATVLLDISPRKEAEQALEVRQEIFASIVSQATDSIALVDVQTGRFLEFNEAAHRDLGYSREAFAQLSLIDIVADHSPEDIHRTHERTREYGGVQFETRHRCRNGEIRTVLVRTRQLVLRDHAYVAAVWSDITERNRMEHQLRQRLKELSCLRQVQNLLEKSLPLDELCAQIVRCVVPALQFPQVALAKIQLDGRKYSYSDSRANHQSTAGYPLTAEILTKGEYRGFLMVHYLDDSPFVVPEEQSLLDGITRSLGLWLERQEAEASLRRRDAQYRLVAENAADVIWTVDLATLRFTFVSPAVRQLLGYTPLEILKCSVDQVVSSAVLEQVKAHLAKWPPSPELPPATLELEHLRKDGSVVPVEITFSYALDDLGRLKAVGVTRDISRRRQAEKEIRKLSLVVEQSPESIVITDVEARIEYVNDAFLERTGYSREEALGQNPRILQSGKTSRRVFVEMWQKLHQGEPWRGELVNRRKDGREYTESVLIFPLREPSHGVTHYLAIKQDITESKRLAEELDRHRHQLEDLVHQRSSELAAIFKALPDLYFRMDRKGAILDYQAGRFSDLYIPPEFFLHRHIVDVLPPEVANRVEFALRQIDDGKLLMDFEYDLPLPEGRKTFEARLVPLEADQVVAVVRDVTERRLAQDQLRESEENFRNFFDTSTDLLVVASSDRRILYTNAAVTERLGHGAVELAAMNLLDLYANGEGSKAEQIWSAVFRGERIRSFLPLAGKGGVTVSAETRAWRGCWNGAECVFGVITLCEDPPAPSLRL